jgi:hypothetical protein
MSLWTDPRDTAILESSRKLINVESDYDDSLDHGLLRRRRLQDHRHTFGRTGDFMAAMDEG